MQNVARSTTFCAKVTKIVISLKGCISASFWVRDLSKKAFWSSLLALSNAATDKMWPSFFVHVQVVEYLSATQSRNAKVSLKSKFLILLAVYRCVDSIPTGRPCGAPLFSPQVDHLWPSMSKIVHLLRWAHFKVFIRNFFSIYMVPSLYRPYNTVFLKKSIITQQNDPKYFCHNHACAAFARLSREKLYYGQHFARKSRKVRSI